MTDDSPSSSFCLMSSPSLISLIGKNAARNVQIINAETRMAICAALCRISKNQNRAGRKRTRMQISTSLPHPTIIRHCSRSQHYLLTLPIQVLVYPRNIRHHKQSIRRRNTIDRMPTDVECLPSNFVT